MRIRLKDGPSNRREFILSEHMMGDDVHNPKVKYFLHEVGNPLGGGYQYFATLPDGTLLFEWVV